MAPGAARSAVITAFVAALHVGAALGFTMDHGESLEGGEAPVINLTLEPAPRFDSLTPPAIAAGAAAAGGAAAAATAAPKVKLRPASVSASEIALPVQQSSSDPVVAPKLVMAMARTVSGAATPASGPAVQIASEAGATQGGGGQSLGGAARPLEDVYLARVIAWIEQNKRAPAGAGAGLVTVRFVLDRRGAVRDVRLVRSGGSRLLDDAALNQIRATQPFPRPEAAAAWRTREFTLNIDYRRP